MSGCSRSHARYSAAVICSFSAALLMPKSLPHVSTNRHGNLRVGLHSFGKGHAVPAHMRRTNTMFYSSVHPTKRLAMDLLANHVVVLPNMIRGVDVVQRGHTCAATTTTPQRQRNKQKRLVPPARPRERAGISCTSERCFATSSHSASSS